MKKLYAGVLFLIVSSLQLTAMEPVAQAARDNAAKLLRAFYPRTKVVDFSGGNVELDLLDECTLGDKRSCSLLRVLVQKRKTASLFRVSEVERWAVNNKAAYIQHIVAGLLDPQLHPCHNLTKPCGELSNGYPFAKKWIQEGCLRKKVEAKHQLLFYALRVLSAE